MGIELILEIHFHQPDEASVYLENTATAAEDIKFGEILLFCCLTLRLLVNLGIRNPVASGTATLLTQISDYLADFTDVHENDVRLVEYKGRPGRKRFEAILSYSDRLLKFKLKPKGFGLFARGIGYYSPHSIMILLRYLVKRHSQDAYFFSSLAQATKRCGEVFITGHYIEGQLSVFTQHKIALMVAAEVFKTDEQNDI
ncbi:MAG: hypothetical protein RBG1_1C00001G0245 [candidate division Zixibacteria bacterium RBG-1]|nr:MAG: hypothetical protein RBG1_1C00001G0245 [candidate division Zixibacteria bacterium RBG-1]OGC85469.1 MAG: hypothetical protein A2V73_06190 [candidate division Zixibacteria bacterium RBG_19FT_COMBO_42_43]